MLVKLHKPLHRRTLLRGAAYGVTAAVALPLLEAMLDENGEALAGGGTMAPRFMTWSFGNGVRLARFVPTVALPDTNWELSEELEPLAEWKNYVSVLTGFNNRSNYFITHHEGNTIFSGYDLRDVGQGPGFFSNAGGPTIDQVIAQVIGRESPITSVQCGVSKRPSDADFGTTTHNLSHRDYQQPLPPNVRPVEVFQSLFESFTPAEDPRKELRVRLVDMVKTRSKELKKRLGSEDQKRIDAHLDGLDELQKKIEALPPPCDEPTAPTENNDDVGGEEQLVNVTSVMHDLIVQAFKCDITRVASMRFTEPASLTEYSEIGQNSSYHELTHDFSSATQNGAVHEGVIFAMERFADLLKKLSETPDGPSGTLLDSVGIFCSTECAEGQSHTIDGQPMIIAGRAGGKLVHPGVHYRSSGGNPSDALLALLQCYDESATEVGEVGGCGSNSPLEEIKAAT
jgi:hypothetical protein